MQITVRLVASFRYNRFNTEARQCPDGTTARQIAEELGLPLAQVGIVLVNGLHATLDTVLQDGDAITLMPRIGGG